MKKVIFIFSSLILAAGLFYQFCMFPNQIKVSCEIQEHTKQGPESVTTILLAMSGAEGDGTTFESQQVKDVKVHLRAHPTAVRTYEIFGKKGVARWQLNQNFEDANLGVHTVNSTNFQTSSGMERQLGSIKVYDRANGDHLQVSCASKESISL